MSTDALENGLRYEQETWQGAGDSPRRGVASYLSTEVTVAYLLGIDSGLTVTKAVVFDEDGTEVSRAERRLPQLTPRPRWVERDIGELWQAAGEAVREALVAVRPSEIAAVGVTGHGDGLYLVDAASKPVRAAILSLDSRAHSVLAEWNRTGVSDRAFEVTGQRPWAASPATILSWLARHDPEALDRAKWALSCKDAIKLWLTGAVSTDPTDASTSFTALHTQEYSDEAFAAYGLTDFRHLVAPVYDSLAITGEVTRSAARITGLVPGTPVASGMHDVDACAVGTGCIHPGQHSLVAGTYSINQVISDHPRGGAHWNARNFVIPGLWMNMAISPASATNLEWFMHHLGAAEVADARARGTDVFEVVSEEVESVAGDPSDLVYLPFLFGSPLGPGPDACLLGMRGWHTRAHLLRAVFEGVAFNHRWHVDALREAFPLSSTRLTGGASRSPVWSQLFADVLGRKVDVVRTRESGALGAAVAAGVGSGAYTSLSEAVDRTVRVARTYHPDDRSTVRLDEAYLGYRRAVDVLSSYWPDTEEVQAVPKPNVATSMEDA